MFDEPYRWIEAVSNRREYLEEQLKAASPVVALPCLEGILLLSVSAGTRKLYEIYDRIALGAMGHPADVERLRNVVLDMAHVEGFNRSPADVTARRLLQFGLAPQVKQAFEEIGRAPYIIRLLIAELGPRDAPVLYTLNYDGVFKAAHHGLVLAPFGENTARAEAALKALSDPAQRPMSAVFEDALRLWALGEVAEDQVETHLKEAIKDRTVEAGLLSVSLPGPSKYRPVSEAELRAWTQPWRAA
ncbi:MAG: proteasome subunit alpha [Nitrospiria bacterium]